jgi:hypothetical protein
MSTPTHLLSWEKLAFPHSQGVSLEMGLPISAGYSQGCMRNWKPPGSHSTRKESACLLLRSWPLCLHPLPYYCYLHLRQTVIVLLWHSSESRQKFSASEQIKYVILGNCLTSLNFSFLLYKTGAAITKPASLSGEIWGEWKKRMNFSATAWPSALS